MINLHGTEQTISWIEEKLNAMFDRVDSGKLKLKGVSRLCWIDNIQKHRKQDALKNDLKCKCQRMEVHFFWQISIPDPYAWKLEAKIYPPCLNLSKECWRRWNKTWTWLRLKWGLMRHPETKWWVVHGGTVLFLDSAWRHPPSMTLWATLQVCAGIPPSSRQNETRQPGRHRKIP